MVSNPTITMIVTFVVGILTYIGSASTSLPAQYAPIVALSASAIAAYLTHDYLETPASGASAASATGATPPP